MPEEQEQKQETVHEACDRLRDAARNILTIVSDFTNDPRSVLLELADRVERASKREQQDAMKTAFLTKCKVCEKVGPASVPGNAAAIREAPKESTALLAVVRGDEYEENITRQIDRNTDVLFAPPEPPSNAAATRAALDWIADIAKDAFGGPERHRKASQGRALSLIVDTARAALSKPARNVDRFQTYEEAVKAYRAWTYQNTGNVSNVSGLGMLGWLFAPAEGETTK